jgi:hypothetical protein
MEIDDLFNNQFRLYDYIAKLNIDGFMMYLENNNTDINYYCFYLKVIDGKRHVITSQTTKRVLNGYKLITIKNVDKDSVIYENVCIKVTCILDNINGVSNKLGIMIVNFDNQLVCNQECNQMVNYNYKYDKNIAEDNIVSAVNVRDLNIILNNLKNLRFSINFNQIIEDNVLPNSLQTLTFGYCYNQMIGENVLPNSLQALTFGYFYNQMIGENVLPDSLRALTFCYLYNQTIGENVLPKSLQNLTFSSNYDKVISFDVIPKSLQTITFDCYNDYGKKFKHNIVPHEFTRIEY